MAAAQELNGPRGILQLAMPHTREIREKQSTRISRPTRLGRMGVMVLI